MLVLNKSPWFIIGALMRGLLDTQPSIQVCAKIDKVVHLSMLCIYSIITIQIHRFPLKSAEMMDGKIFQNNVFSFGEDSILSFSLHFSKMKISDAVKYVLVF